MHVFLRYLRFQICVSPWGHEAHPTVYPVRYRALNIWVPTSPDLGLAGELLQNLALRRRGRIAHGSPVFGSYSRSGLRGVRVPRYSRKMYSTLDGT
jgi:hypothetical protein